MRGSERKISISIAIIALLVVGMMWASRTPVSAKGGDLGDLLGTVQDTVDPNNGQFDPTTVDSVVSVVEAPVAPVE